MHIVLEAHLKTEEQDFETECEPEVKTVTQDYK